MKVKSEKTRELLLHYGAKAFGEKGYAGTNINEVSVQAGFGKGTIYNYFQNKADLFLAVFTKTMSDIAEYISEAIEGIENPIERMEKALHRDFQFFHDHRDLTLVIIRESFSADRDNQEKYLEAASPVFQLFMDIVADGIKKGFFSKKTNPLLATLMLIGMCENLILTEQLLNASFGSAKELADTVLTTFIKGIEK